ncbi:ARM repeat superfamily protein [Artemisia annua]|uniref:ARM repeat superfamily protein n=1 Tax=Artemisia annua TaxID=35608 RepID=A0A2U1PEX0_ARTAN|nr:ARM repeat superfamily protein [Artemisia annua]
MDLGFVAVLIAMEKVSFDNLDLGTGVENTNTAVVENTSSDPSLATDDQTKSTKSKHDYINVLFGVSLKTMKDIDDFTKGCEDGTYSVWNELESDVRTMVMEAVCGLAEAFSAETIAKSTTTKPTHEYPIVQVDSKKGKREAWYPACAVSSRFPGPFGLVVTAQDAKTRATVWSSRRPFAFCRKTPALALGWFSLETSVKAFDSSFLPFFDELSLCLMPLLGKDKTAEERRIAIRIFILVAKQCREAALRYKYGLNLTHFLPKEFQLPEVLRSSIVAKFARRFYDAYLPFLFEACNNENSDVRQAAAYGLGVCTEYVGSAIKPLIGEALSSLNAVIRHPDALHPDKVMAYDNAVSALGKICHFHGDSIDSAQVIPAWLSCLPIKGDVVEAKAVHELLSVMIERRDAELLGPNNQYLPKIVSIFTEILCADKNLASDQTISRISNLLRHNFGWDVSCVPDIQQPWMGCFG